MTFKKNDKKRKNTYTNTYLVTSYDPSLKNFYTHYFEYEKLDSKAVSEIIEKVSNCNEKVISIIKLDM